MRARVGSPVTARTASGWHLGAPTNVVARTRTSAPTCEPSTAAGSVESGNDWHGLIRSGNAGQVAPGALPLAASSPPTRPSISVWSAKSWPPWRRAVSSVVDALTTYRPARSEPWDAGPEITPRDLAALRFVGEQYVVRLDALAVVLGRLSPTAVRNYGRLGNRTVRQRVERWEQAGWANRRRLLGQTWVLLTRAGLRLVGLEFDCWEPAASRLVHHHEVAVVRLAREPIPGQGGWVCERELWRRRGRASWHLADGALPAPVPAGWQGIDQAWELVEVELTQKVRPDWRPRSRLDRRTPPPSPTTSPTPSTRHCRRNLPAWSGS